jgi:Fe-S-cluster containining protein
MMVELSNWLATGEQPDDTIDFLNDKGQFECIQCGACCRDIRWVYPNLIKEGCKSVCQHLTETNRCSIYEERPYYCVAGNFREEGDDVKIARACSWLRSKHPPGVGE